MMYRRIVILTGAGISAESGMGTFRDKDGIWTTHRLEDVATPQGFARNPTLVHSFYNLRRAGLKSAAPNRAHFALAEFEQRARSLGSDVMLVTQNVDDLHERAGSQSIVHMHGELTSAVCASCGGRVRWEEDMSLESLCPSCGRQGALRPDVVWFGEVPHSIDEIHDRISTCDLFVSIGTSGEVYPAAGFVRLAAGQGAHTVELNLEPSANAGVFSEGLYGPATQVVERWVNAVLSSDG
jgi:NAD-dependent deacetylase